VIWSEFHGKGRDDLGFTSGQGIAGTLSRGSCVRMFNLVTNVLNSRPYEFVDIGAGTGVMVMLSFAFDAIYACGVEYQPSSLGFVFDAARHSLEKALHVPLSASMIHFQRIF
jgi:predicted RNA methylase